MKRVKEMPVQVKSLIKSRRVIKPLYTYKKDGIYVNFGPLEGKNISKMYIENPEEVEYFIENIFDADSASIRVIMDTVEVYKDLKNNYYGYEC
jgi:hypothetical protein